MFKKPLGATKTSAPLRSSDRRKLRQRIVDAYGVSNDDGDLLVPDGILSLKFTTHLAEPGVVYLAPDGDPLWFTVGKGSEDLIPTVYTLWKRQDLLPTLSTPAAVIPVLVGGADLMIPGVIHHTPNVQAGQLVSILQYNHDHENPSLSPPLAIGRMAVPSQVLSTGRRAKGKAVFVMHTWKDHLWDMGSKEDIPAPTILKTSTISKTSASERDSSLLSEDVEVNQSPSQDDEDTVSISDNTSDAPAGAISNLAISGTSSETILPQTTSLTYTPQEISTLLNITLCQAIKSRIPSSTFPIPATTFYTNYLLPARPAFPGSVLPPSTPDVEPIAHEVTIKSSSHKSLTAFLKAAEKANFLTIKAPPKHSKQTDVVVTSVNEAHQNVVAHIKHVTVGEIEERAAKKAERVEKERERAEKKEGEVQVIELWKPRRECCGVFEGVGASTAEVYTLSEVRTHLNNYINTKSLVDPMNQASINLDEVLVVCIGSKAIAAGVSATGQATKQKGAISASEPRPKIKGAAESSRPKMRRDELTKALLDRMQQWHEVRVEGKDSVRRKGPIGLVQVNVKMRQGRKVCTLITGYEPFLVVDGEEMAEDLRKICASATSVSPIPGRPGLEVLVQGKQSKAAVEYLTGKGLNKKWIEVHDATGKK